jgi:hypothetical protein
MFSRFVNIMNKLLYVPSRWDSINTRGRTRRIEIRRYNMCRPDGTFKP